MIEAHSGGGLKMGTSVEDCRIPNRVFHDGDPPSLIHEKCEMLAPRPPHSAGDQTTQVVRSDFEP